MPDCSSKNGKLGYCYDIWRCVDRISRGQRVSRKCEISRTNIYVYLTYGRTQWDCIDLPAINHEKDKAEQLFFITCGFLALKDGEECVTKHCPKYVQAHFGSECYPRINILHDGEEGYVR
jgi:hypothetical protein